MSHVKIDVAAALHGLKDFQRRTVEYVFQRMYQDKPATQRFLIADEVGLGKTLIARGIIAQAVEHLQKSGVKRIDVLYICSNASIAQQNLNKLNVTEQPTSNFATRLTLLPKQLDDLRSNGVNFISFTPGTTFDLKSSGGRIDERVLIYHMLLNRLDVRRRCFFRLLQCSASPKGWARAAHGAPEYDKPLADAFARTVQEDKPFLRQLQDVCGRFHRVKRVSSDLNSSRLEVVGGLRRRLADVCIEALEPDLVILDEFQRFKDLLHGCGEAAELAQRLFAHPEVRVILLSATPYRMLTMDHESEDDHYADFRETLRFLYHPDELPVKAVGEELRTMRASLYGIDHNAADLAEASRRRLEQLLRQVMTRTERIDMARSVNAMLVEPPQPTTLTPEDLQTARFVGEVARCLDAGDVVEYWKSSPYLLNFMDGYELKRKLKDCRRPSEELLKVLRNANGALLKSAPLQRYRPAEPANPRLRHLIENTVGAGQWQWLWLPASMPYTQPGGAYQGSGPATKSLVFSSWQVVPDSIAALCSYEAERLMLQRESDRPSYRQLHRKRRPLLQFRAVSGKATTMTVMTLLYPSAVLASLLDPLKLALELGAGAPVSREVMLQAGKERLAPKLGELLGTARDQHGGPDERWYWAAPVLLDRLHAEEMIAWINEGLLGALVVDDEEEVGNTLREHVSELQEILHRPEVLGRPPEDLLDVLVELGLGSPAICAVRALQRVAPDLPETSMTMLTSAVRVALGMRSIFNQPEATALVRSPNDAFPYWRNVVSYCIDGNLQAVLDEYSHMLKESEGLAQRSGSEIAEGVSKATAEAMTLRTSNLSVDDIKPKSSGIKRLSFHMRCRFGMRFGDVRDDDGKTLVRSGNVRQAFNSPFRPFILASTSVGQEGLDFHPYCHVVYHWNLPANPVDLEQREGRVHRYKGHAVRRNIAKAYGLGALQGRWHDPWQHLFSRAADDRDPASSELVPYWIYETDGGHCVERRVPMLPLSREIGQLQRLKSMLTVYRMAFGQPRQEDLLCYLASRGNASSPGSNASTWRLRLSPTPTEDTKRSSTAVAERARSGLVPETAPV